MLTSGHPFLGNAHFTLDLMRARAASICVFALSLRQQSLALGGGCTLYVADPLVPLGVVSNGAGFASVRFAIPPDPVLRGLTIYAQAVVVDPSGPVAGLAFSAGRRLISGD